MRKMFTWLRALAASVGGLWLLVSFTPLDSWWAHHLASPWGNCKGDILIVLGGDSISDGVLGSSSYWRAVYTVRAMREHSFAKVIIAGGGGQKGATPPAELMRDFIRGHGIDVANVTAETESASTFENVQAAARLLGPATGAKVVLLTSDYHVWRAFRVFRKAGIVVDTCPVPDVLKRSNSWNARSALFVELAVETTKIAWYRWQGWI